MKIWTNLTRKSTPHGQEQGRYVALDVNREVLSHSLATHQKTRILFSARHIWTSSFRKFSLVCPKFWITWHSRGLNVGLRRTKFFKKKLCDSTSGPGACDRQNRLMRQFYTTPADWHLCELFLNSLHASMMWVG
jgi:hypothetical protein